MVGCVHCVPVYICLTVSMSEGVQERLLSNARYKVVSFPTVMSEGKCMYFISELKLSSIRVACSSTIRGYPVTGSEII